ncbi:FAD-binding oxidoreductase [Kribbella sp. CA-253562]|uniref:FAD-binding oxidoreductase n=1 Tax=Kribbella sp. CA-253562 TaxID=3239942 RepID=UPI003D8A94D7
MTGLDSLDGIAVTPGSAAYDAVRRPVQVAYAAVRPRVVVLCRSVSDVVAGLRYAAESGDRVVARGGGHCFAGRSSTDGVVLELSGLDRISVADGIATIGAGARLRSVYSSLHEAGRTVPAGCGPTVGIAGLTLGGGIGLLGRKYGLTCDRLVGVQVVLADGRVVECSEADEPELFWGIRGAGGGQFGVVTELRFATVPEPVVTRIDGYWPDAAELVSAWQEWAPDAPDEVTVNLRLVSEPGSGVRATVFGASMLGVEETREVLPEFASVAGVGVPWNALKDSLADPLADPLDGPAVRLRSEFFARSLRAETVESLLALLGEPRTTGRREIAFTAMGGQYNRVAEDATAFAHRGERFLLEHIAEVTDRDAGSWVGGSRDAGSWVDRSWDTAHVDGSGRVYPNFPDLALDDWASAYHAGNLFRLQEIKRWYDPQRVFEFPQAI